MSEYYPHIRPLNFQPFTHAGRQMWLVQDPQQLAGEQLILPPLLAHMTLYCDGRHDLEAIGRALDADFGGPVPRDVIEEAVTRMDELYLLYNGRCRSRIAELREQYRSAPYRPMALADINYPRDPAALAKQFDEYAADDNDTEAAEWADWTGRAVVSPHIDYQRGGAVYAKTWRRAATAVQQADLVLMFATDHNGGLGSLTLTKQPYQTPHGVLPTDPDLVDKLAAAIGQEHAYDLELNHRREHSVELSAVWLHHVAGDNPPPMVPLLLGSFQHFVMENRHPMSDERMAAFINTLRTETAGRRVLCVASVDLAHVGPAFDDTYVMDAPRREALIRTDDSLMTAVTVGDAERFYEEIAAVQDRNKVCGFSPIYLMMRYLGADIRGHRIDYQHCSADAEDHSLVSICGLLLE